MRIMVCNYVFNVREPFCVCLDVEKGEGAVKILLRVVPYGMCIVCVCV